MHHKSVALSLFHISHSLPPLPPPLQYMPALPHMAPPHAFYNTGWQQHSVAPLAASYAAPPAGYAGPAGYAVAPAGTVAASAAAPPQGGSSAAVPFSAAQPYAHAGGPREGLVPPPPPQPAAAIAVCGTVGAEAAPHGQEQQLQEQQLQQQ